MGCVAEPSMPSMGSATLGHATPSAGRPVGELIFGFNRQCVTRLCRLDMSRRGCRHGSVVLDRWAQPDNLRFLFDDAAQPQTRQPSTRPDAHAAKNGEVPSSDDDAAAAWHDTAAA
jgi:hypothetical protein